MRIKEIRKRTGLSQPQFAEKYSIPLPTLRHWERGDRECPKYVLDLLEFKVKMEVSEMKDYTGMKWGELTEMEKAEMLKNSNTYAGNFGFEHDVKPGEECIVDLMHPYSIAGRAEVTGDGEIGIVIDDDAVIYNPSGEEF